MPLPNIWTKNVELDEEVRIHFIGCPNACGQKHIADIGLQGALVKTPEGMVDAFDLSVGGILGPGAKFNETLKGRVKGDQVGPVLEQLILFFKENRGPEESFHQFVGRVGVQAFQEKIDFDSCRNRIRIIPLVKKHGFAS